MPQYTLQPHLFNNRTFQPDTSKENLTLTFRKLCERLAPPPIQTNVALLKGAKVGDLIGLLRNRQGVLVPFVLHLERDEGLRMDWLLEKQPEFPKQFQLAYRIEKIDWMGGFKKKPA